MRLSIQADLTYSFENPCEVLLLLEAARAIGMPTLMLARRILMPQIFRLSLPGLGFSALSPEGGAAPAPAPAALPALEWMLLTLKRSHASKKTSRFAAPPRSRRCAWSHGARTSSRGWSRPRRC